MKLVAKYRPKSLDGIIGQEKILDVTRRWLKRREMPDVILAGPPGTGKTSWAYCVVSEFFGGFDVWNKTHPDFLELNASDERGIDVVRDKVKEWASVEKPADSAAPFRVVFFDEADKLTNDAQTALRNTVEKYEDRCRFIYSGNKDDYIDAITSRAATMHFTAIPEELCIPYFKNIAKKEGVSFNDDALHAIYWNYKGDIRRMLNDCLEKQIGTDHVVTTNDLDFSDTMSASVLSILGALKSNQPPVQRYAEARKLFTQQHTKLQFNSRDFLEALFDMIGPMSFGCNKAFSEADDRLRAGGTKDIHVGYVLEALANEHNNT